MTQASHPSAASCAALLRALPALAALKRNIRHVMPEEVGWLPSLSVITRHDGLRLTQVADILHVDASVASRHVAHLESIDFVAREKDPADGRASLLRATEGGRAWMDETVARFAEHVSGSLPGWTDAEVDQLVELLQRLGSSLEVAARQHHATIALAPTDATTGAAR